MPGNENTKSGILQGLFICRTSELNPRCKNHMEFIIYGLLAYGVWVIINLITPRLGLPCL